MNSGFVDNEDETYVDGAALDAGFRGDAVGLEDDGGCGDAVGGGASASSSGGGAMLLRSPFKANGGGFKSKAGGISTLYGSPSRLGDEVTAGDASADRMQGDEVLEEEESWEFLGFPFAW